MCKNGWVMQWKRCQSETEFKSNMLNTENETNQAQQIIDSLKIITEYFSVQVRLDNDWQMDKLHFKKIFFAIPRGRNGNYDIFSNILM